MARFALALVFLPLALAACDGGGDDATPTLSSTTAPASPATEGAAPVAVPSVEPASNISLPPGFSAYAIAGGFYRATSVAVAGDGSIFVSERHGRVLRLFDRDGDGVFETAAAFAETAGEITGILAAPGGGLYVSSTGELLLFHDTDGDGAADSSQAILSGLPNGRHQNNGLALGPDGTLYLTNGSTCDDCAEADERSAVILQANPDGSGLRVYAGGLRNPYDLAFDADGRLWATDNGSDEPCATVDELNLIVEGEHYGWPYGEDGCDPFADGAPPVADLGLHTASTGLASYDAQHFPQEYRGLIFATLWGSFFGEPELPPQLLSINVRDDAPDPRARVATFAEGFHHPIDLTVDADGTLLVLDYGEGSENDTSGTLYRIVYTGE